MLFNYFKLAVRRLHAQLSFTIINALGLCLGMTCFMLIAEYVTFEGSYNGFHTKAPNIFRVLNQNDLEPYVAFTAPGMAGLATSHIRGIEEFCRVADASAIGGGIISVEGEETQEKSFRENGFAYVDGSFFTMFSFALTKGDKNALERPNAAAISTSTATKYFGTGNAIGRVLTLSNQFGKNSYTIEAVYSDMPGNSDLKYELLLSLSTFANKANLGGNESWAGLDVIGSQWLYSFVSVPDGAVPDQLGKKLTTLMKQRLPDQNITVALQGLSSMHLGRDLNEPYPTFGSLRFNYFLSGIAILIVIIAWFNFVNLSTASALSRAREVGIRKVVGATRSQLIKQFMGESLLLNVLALVLSVALVNLLQVPFNHLIEKKLSLSILGNKQFWPIALIFLFIGTIATGAYTAFVLSSFNPSKVLKGVFSKSAKGAFVRKSLVTAQFSISVLLISATIILYQQWQFMKTKDLGLNSDQIVVIKGAEVNRDDSFKDRTVEFQNNIRNASFVQKFSRSGNVPTDGFNFATTGFTKMNPRPGDEKVSYDMLMIDHQYLDTYEIPLVAGSNFTSEMCEKPWEQIEYVLLNEQAVKSLGFASIEEAIGQKIKSGNRQLIIRGVTKDYHHLSVQNAITPVIFIPRSTGSYYSIKLAGSDYSSMILQLEKFYQKSFPGNPFEFEFLDQAFASKYATEEQYSHIFSIASGLAIVIGCLGLFGLATYSVQQRTKEISIRKVLGSSGSQIVQLISRDFLLLICLAFIIAAPLSWYMMHRWLLGFAYRVDIAWWVYLLSGSVTLLIALFTVGARALKVAGANPVDALRKE